VPFPPNYGGVIDVFYKLKALFELGVEIYLHTYEYGRGKPKELEKYCKQVFYYKRNSFIKSILSKTPFIVKSRSSIELIVNLKINKSPILFEGLHTTYPLLKNEFKSQKIIIRTHNIEHLYYKGLSTSERRIDKKIFFKTESKKLAVYEKILFKTDYILTISPSEHDYFSNQFIDKAIYTPVFHQNTKVKELSKKGKYAFYHGDLRVADNIKAVYFLIDLFKEIKYPFKIASSFINKSIINEISKHKYIEFEEIKDQKHMNELLNDAHINVLPTFQKTGIKLKLINALFNSRFCLVTNEMIEDTGLEKLCEIASTKVEFKKKIIALIDRGYTKTQVEKRKVLLQSFNVKKSAKKIIKLLN